MFIPKGCINVGVVGSVATVTFVLASCTQVVDQPNSHRGGIYAPGIREMRRPLITSVPHQLPLNALREVGIGGSRLESLAVSGSRLSAVQATTGRHLYATDLVGTTAKLEGVPSYFFRIDNIVLEQAGMVGDVWLYTILYRNNAKDLLWRSVCLDNAGKPEPLIIILGHTWDEVTGLRSPAPGVVTLACVSGAVGSCARWGYWPWSNEKTIRIESYKQIINEKASLFDYHQACIYAKRADYCGNGVSHTVNNTIIDLYDRLNLFSNSRTTDWPIEARWDRDGAQCLSARRHPEISFEGGCWKGDHFEKLPLCKDSDALGSWLLTTRIARR